MLILCIVRQNIYPFTYCPKNYKENENEEAVKTKLKAESNNSNQDSNFFTCREYELSLDMPAKIFASKIICKTAIV